MLPASAWVSAARVAFEKLQVLKLTLVAYCWDSPARRLAKTRANEMSLAMDSYGSNLIAAS